MNQNVGKLDPIQMQRKVYDEQIEANRVTVVGTEMGIELSAQDGDSILAIPMSQSLAEGIHSIAGMKTLCKYGECSLKVSPLDEGDLWLDLSAAELEPKAICARRLKIEGTGLVVVQSV